MEEYTRFNAVRADSTLNREKLSRYFSLFLPRVQSYGTMQEELPPDVEKSAGYIDFSQDYKTDDLSNERSYHGAGCAAGHSGI